MPTDFGYRMERGELVVAAPLCPSEKVFGAESYISVDGEGDGDGFTRLWRATDPRSPEAAAGVFTVNTDKSFGTVEKPMSVAQPQKFYVAVRQSGDADYSRTDYVDLSRLKSAELADDEFVTYEGKVMTREEINAQRTCSKT
ncbi:hypothetical protein [Streptomyces sp. NBC_00059]|uniref:hypothetical protein n=1 Tax=Streptomyces sp. NBC_00059 TaxID=2975635 RepID=UPI00225A2BEC|nr:hypothetical protein [Streptomyces sp. NBC_00059]MCX5412564.1 hypothetical protein [Streptomyces sp. NBC_00059]